MNHPTDQIQEPWQRLALQNRRRRSIKQLTFFDVEYDLKTNEYRLVVPLDLNNSNIWSIRNFY
ncbi:hypothetical protein M4I21_12785 [Cellulophaga sp. 20_2_10]|uniref:hypothetical protein n=1 Tax=Cellulophaga sp. 20_2_10 TaxID=2942476 RepID=UPI00201B32B7|nr:hypothetical protein [Cellulophaga sp. 20_2_10]MCL5246693.1 hypothetical protein [Cellulophaga sp. 20_2_10]